MDSESPKKGKGTRIMRAILIPLAPRECADVLNGDAVILVRKTAPKAWIDYLNGKGPKPKPTYAYAYCTKGKGDKESNLFRMKYDEYCIGNDFIEDRTIDLNDIVGAPLNGKVVAKFTLRKVESLVYFEDDICKKSCLKRRKILDYLGDEDGYAWHISNLRIIDEPKRPRDFFMCMDRGKKGHSMHLCFWPLQRAPRNWQYVEAPEC